MSELLSGEPVYFGDAGFLGGKADNSGSYTYHKDSVDRDDYSKPDWTSSYTVYRVGFYLSDHSIKSGSIAFRKKSHEKSFFMRFNFHKYKILTPLLYAIDFIDLIMGKSVYSASSSRDLLIWKLTTDHAANAGALKFARSRAITRFTNWIPNNFRIPPFEGDRLGFVATFGKSDAHLHRYVEYLKTRKYMVLKWMNTDYKGLDRIGLYKLLDVPDSINKSLGFDELLNSASDAWKPFD
jgi:hypothetical protein